MHTNDEIKNLIERTLGDESNRYILLSCRENVEKIIRYLENSAEKSIAVPFNIMIVCDDFQKSWELCEKIHNIVWSLGVSGKGFLNADIKDWYTYRVYWPENECNDTFLDRVTRINEGYKGIVFSNIDLKAVQDGMWNNLVGEMERDARPDIVKIACVNKAAAQYIKEHNEAIFYRYFANDYHIIIEAPTTDEIYKQLLLMLSKNGLQPDEQFKEKICRYIDVVYPKADLKDMKFVADLRDRVVRSQLCKEEYSNVVGADCVPYYNNGQTDDWAKLPYLDYKGECASGDIVNVQDGEKAAILLVPSTFNNRNVKESFYQSEDSGEGKKYRGIQTNDAPVQYLIDSIYGNGDVLTKVICLSSKEVMYETKNEIGGHTAYDRIKELVERYIKINYPSYTALDVEQITIDCEDYDPEKGKVLYNNGRWSYETVEIPLKERLPYIFESLLNMLKDCTKVYIDFTGGQRDMNFLMVSIIRFLQATGLSCEKIIYSNINRRGETNVLVEMDVHYNMFKIINATDEFLNTGSARQLKAFFGSGNNGIDNMDEALAVISAINTFSDMINLCCLNNLDSAVIELVKNINSLDNTESKNLYSQMLKALIPTIKDRLYLQDVIMEDNKINYPVIIRWCLDNNLVQQALTLYVELMPKYYFENGYIPKSLVDPAQISKKGNLGSNRYADGFYSQLFVRIMEKDIKYIQLEEIINNIVPYSMGDSVERNKKAILTRQLIQLFIKVWDGETSRTAAGNFMKGYEKFKEDFDTWIGNKQFNSTEAKYTLLINKKLASTYYKKLLVIKVLDECEIPELKKGKDTLHQMMIYYLMAKMLRNQMNHANGSEQEDYIKNNIAMAQTAEYMNQNLLSTFNITNIIENGDNDKITDLIRQGIDFLEEKPEKIEWVEKENKAGSMHDLPVTTIKKDDNYELVNVRRTGEGEEKIEGELKTTAGRFKGIILERDYKDYDFSIDDGKLPVKIKRIEGDHYILELKDVKSQGNPSGSSSKKYKNTTKIGNQFTEAFKEKGII